MKTILAILLLVTAVLSWAIQGNPEPARQPALYPMILANIGQCMGDCASEQGMCIGQCGGNGRCIANCNAAHGRCVARCTR